MAYFHIFLTIFLMQWSHWRRMTYFHIPRILVNDLNYLVNDCYWIIKKIENMINQPLVLLFSLSWGRLTLIRLVLCGIPAYWFFLIKIPVSITNTLRWIMFNFLWGGSIDVSEKYIICLDCILVTFNSINTNIFF